MKHALWSALCLSCLAAPALADDTGTTAIGVARGFMLAALPGQCDESSPFGDADGFADTATALSWRPQWAGADDPDSHATLYQLFCMAGAYNVVQAYVFKPENGDLSLITFAQPTYEIDYADGDETQTELKNPPKVTGYSTTATLVNSGFDTETQMLTSFAKWRGLGDAWSAGTWAFSQGQFVLERYEIDPTYEANDDNASEDQMERSYTLFP
tara:strand:- start:179 stop:817 length:639 start_codon:yes stop_codon:yes gene_type:complete